MCVDPEELCEDNESKSVQSSGTHNALLQRAQAAEERARRSEEALARAMEDLNRLKSVTVNSFNFILTIFYRNLKDSIFLF